MYRRCDDTGGSVRASEEVATEIEEAGLVINENEKKYIKININTTKSKI
jgi:hypothetical protein